jgi:energy-converting hydrogenase Eha subunit C
MTFRAPRCEEKQLLLLWGAAAGGILLLGWALPGLAPFLPRCPFKELTGLPCLSCGSTRTALALLRGDVGTALQANPLAAVLGIALVAGGMLAPLWAVLRLPVPDALPAATPGRRAAAVAFLLAAWGWQIARGI